MRRSIWIPSLVLPILLLAGLIMSALQPMQVRAFALGSLPVAQVAVLGRGQEACEGPIRLPTAVGDARFWGSGTGGFAVAEISVRDAPTGRLMATGWTLATPAGGDSDATLDASIPSGSTVRVCVTGEGPSSLGLAGSAPIHSQILMSLGRKPTQTEFSLVLLEPARQSLLGALPTAFRRAALFRFSWAGPWVFWLLAVALLGAIASCGWAVAAAARTDLSEEPRRSGPTAAREPQEAPLSLHLND